MQDRNKVHYKEIPEINLLAKPRITQRWIPQFLRRQQYWKTFSGNWKLELPERIVYFKDARVQQSENASIIGSSEWRGYSLQVSFKMLSKSIKPPEGGVILFFLFRNIKNHYSFHFCLYKQKVELIKRLQGMWTTIAERDCKFDINKEHTVRISTGSGVHQCQVDGVTQMEIFDGDIVKGCVGIGAKYCDAEFNRVSVSIPPEGSSVEGEPVG